MMQLPVQLRWDQWDVFPANLTRSQTFKIGTGYLYDIIERMTKHIFDFLLQL